MTSNASDVRLFARFPASYDDLALGTSLQHTKLGPCLVVFDQAVWNVWDKPHWIGEMRPVQPGDERPCSLCGQQTACLSHGPGALALWQGEAAAVILDAMELAEREHWLSQRWSAFCTNATSIEAQDYTQLAERVLQPGFKGFSRLAEHVLDWQNYPAARVPDEDSDPLFPDPSAIRRRLDHVLGLPWTCRCPLRLSRRPVCPP